MGSIKLPPPKFAPHTTKSLCDDKSTPMHAGKSNLHATTKATSLTCPQKDGDIPQLLAKPSLDQKRKRSAKKSLTLVTTGQEKPKEKTTFLKDEDEEHTSISNKGKSKTNQQNDQVVESLLKKPEKKSKEKCPTAQKVFVLTKTRAAKVHGKSNNYRISCSFNFS
jgi:hypothetical protein